MKSFSCICFVLFYAALEQQANGFVVVGPSRTTTSASSFATTTTTTTTSLLQATETTTETETKDNKKETLVFNADSVFVSDPLEGGDKDEVSKFFASETFQDLIFSAGGSRVVNKLSMDFENITELWKETCETWAGTDLLPAEGDALVGVVSTTQFPGMSLETTTCSAVRFTGDDDDNPFYDILLVAEKQKTVGPRPVVWIFEKLTGSADKPKDCYLLPSGRVKSQCRLVEIDNGDKLAVQYDISFEIQVQFPKFLMRILPASKEKMEQQGSASIQKAITKDVTLSLEKVTEFFNNKQQQESSSVSSS